MARSGGRDAASVADLSCGVIGLAYGFAKATIRVTAGNGTDEPCRYAFKANAGSKFICRSVEDLAVDNLSGLYRRSGRRVLIGCVPCRPFSSYGRNRSPGTRWFPLDAFARLVRGTSLPVASMENVSHLRPRAIFEKFLKRLKGGMCRARHDAATCSDYGTPQTIRRPVLLASMPGDAGAINRAHRGGLPAVRDAVGYLDPIRAGCISPQYPHHRSRDLLAADLERISQTTRGGGRRGWVRRLVLPCRRMQSRRSYDRAHGRMRRDRPTPATTLQAMALGSGRFGRTEQDGVPSLGEAAPIRAFPRGHELELGGSGIRIGTEARHMGNTVPAALGNVIALSAKGNLVGHDGGV